jgi:hypothetical protein
MAATSDELSRMRTFKLPRLVPVGQRRVFLLLGPGSKVEDVKFISGSKELQSSGETQRTVDFKSVFPDARSARLLRQGSFPATNTVAALSSSITSKMLRSVN